MVSAHQVPSYAATASPIAANQPGTEKYGSNTAKIDLSQFERQQAELEEREKRLMERERELRNSQLGGKFCSFVIHSIGFLGSGREKNFPPLPNWFPCRPCFYQDISVEIPTEFQIWVRYLYYLWLGKSSPSKTTLICSSL